MENVFLIVSSLTESVGRPKSTPTDHFHLNKHKVVVDVVICRLLFVHPKFSENYAQHENAQCLSCNAKCLMNANSRYFCPLACLIHYQLSEHMNYSNNHDIV